jgi:hypothetical protein
VGTQIIALFDSDASTVMDLNAIGIAAGALGIGGIGWLTRDDKVSSEDSGAK